MPGIASLHCYSRVLQRRFSSRVPSGRGTAVDPALMGAAGWIAAMLLRVESPFAVFENTACRSRDKLVGSIVQFGTCAIHCSGDLVARMSRDVLSKCFAEQLAADFFVRRARRSASSKTSSGIDTIVFIPLV